MQGSNNTYLLFGILLLLGVIAGAWSLADLQSAARAGLLGLAILIPICLAGLAIIGWLLIARDSVSAVLKKDRKSNTIVRSQPKAAITYTSQQLAYAKQRAEVWGKSSSVDPNCLGFVGREFVFNGERYIFSGYMPALERVSAIEIGTGLQTRLNEKFWPSIRASLESDGLASGEA